MTSEQMDAISAVDLEEQLNSNNPIHKRNISINRGYNIITIEERQELLKCLPSILDIPQEGCNTSMKSSSSSKLEQQTDTTHNNNKQTQQASWSIF